MNLFDPNPALQVTYNVYDWSTYYGHHHAKLEANAPLAIPAEIRSASFSALIEQLLLCEELYNMEITLTWS